MNRTFRKTVPDSPLEDCEYCRDTFDRFIKHRISECGQGCALAEVFHLATGSNSRGTFSIGIYIIIFFMAHVFFSLNGAMSFLHSIPWNDTTTSSSAEFSSVLCTSRHIAPSCLALYDLFSFVGLCLEWGNLATMSALTSNIFPSWRLLWMLASRSLHISASASAVDQIYVRHLVALSSLTFVPAPFWSYVGIMLTGR